MNNTVPFEVMFPNLAEHVFFLLERLSTRNGAYRCGASVGYKKVGSNRNFLISQKINPELPDWWEEDSNCAPYSGLKCQTALDTEKDTENISKENLPLMAVHQGGVIRLLEVDGVWVSVAVSGYSGEEDKALAKFALEHVFFPDEVEE